MLLARIRRWSRRRQGLDRRAFAGIDDALAGVVGVYSANPSGPLSLLARLPGLDPGDVHSAIRGRRAVRIPAMRRSIFLVPTSAAHLVFAATRYGNREYDWLLRGLGVSEEEYERLAARVLAACREPLDARAVRAAIRDAPQGERFTAVLQTLCAEGRLVRVDAPSVTSNALTYCATEAWLGAPLEPVPREEAVAWLAGAYLRAFGPASVEDLAWWAALALPEAAAALAAHETVDVGDGLLLIAEDVPPFERARGPHGVAVDLLPKWDAYTMGYGPGGRDRLAAPDVRARVYDDGGNALPVLLVDGEAAGTWRHRMERGTPWIEVEPFEPLPPSVQPAVDREVVRIARLLGAGQPPSSTPSRAKNT